MFDDNILESSRSSAISHATKIEITKFTVKFGSSVYQFRNITGFKTGHIPKKPIFLRIGFSILLLGLLCLNSENYKDFGVFLLGISLFIMFFYYCLYPRKLALALYLNSGDVKYFECRDEFFLIDVIDTLYHFMEEDEEVSERILIDMSVRTITVDGDFYGQAVTGNENEILVNSDRSYNTDDWNYQDKTDDWDYRE